MKSLFHIKNLLFAIVVLPVATYTVQAQSSPRLQLTSLDHLATRASTTVDVNIDERLIGLTAKLLKGDADDAEIKKIIAGVKGIYVKSFEFDSDGQYSSADLEAIRSQLRGPNWSRLVNVSNKKEGDTEVHILLEGEKIGGLAVLSAESRELTVVNIVGPIDLEKLTKLEGQMGIPDLGIEPTKPKSKNEQ
jgi:hypothetical protein